MKIGGHDTDDRVLVVAEVGNNHEGDPKAARELVRAAARAGADAVKLQTFRTNDYLGPAADPDRRARYAGFELDPEVVADLATLARDEGLLFLSTPLDLGSVDLLEELVDAYKVASGDNDFVPLLDRIAAAEKPTVVSTGLSDIATLEAAVDRFRAAWSEDGDALGERLALLHCVSAYPVPDEEANLAAVRTLADRFPDLTVGYSDHTLGVEAGVLAVAAGARILEKHFTLDKAFSDFRDHKLSADPKEMARLVERVRAAETLLGDGEKTPRPSEEEGLTAYRRSIVAGRDLPAGHELTLDDLLWTRPRAGLPPGTEDRLVGRTLIRDVEAGATLTGDDVD